MFNLRIEFKLRPTYDGVKLDNEIIEEYQDEGHEYSLTNHQNEVNSQANQWTMYPGIDAFVENIQNLAYEYTDLEDNPISGPGELSYSLSLPYYDESTNGSAVTYIPHLAILPAEGQDVYYNSLPPNNLSVSSAGAWPTMTWSADCDMPSPSDGKSLYELFVENESNDEAQQAAASTPFYTHVALADWDNYRLGNGRAANPKMQVLIGFKYGLLSAYQYRESVTSTYVYDENTEDSYWSSDVAYLSGPTAIDYVVRMRVFNRNTGHEMFWLDTRLGFTTAQVTVDEYGVKSVAVQFDEDPAFNQVFSSNIWSKLGNTIDVPGLGQRYLGVPVISMSDFAALYGDTSKPSVWETRPSLYEVEE